MIKINNKHVGTLLIIIFLGYPIAFTIITGDWKYVFTEAAPPIDFSVWAKIMVGIAAIELFFIALFLILLTVFLIESLLKNDIKFEWTIKLPKFGRNKTLELNKDTKDLLRQLAHVDKKSHEYDIIWKKLDERGIWG